ncbi:hypothetical protein SDC9_128157 [bioreactor metagenome]|uniref:Uncharacterized protein n=1 Tax=bioreactor metagenome TaxID=1076179 RepID=A0A645CW61_9ZZZZ
MKAIPAEYIPVLHPSKLEETVNQLDKVLSHVVTTGHARTEAYSNKAELIRKKTNYESAIKLTEADAFMGTQGEGKDQHGYVRDKKIFLNNDANRDAFRRASSASERTELANVNADIGYIDTQYAQANDAWQAAVESANIVKVKANLQSALLNFLSGRS